MLIGRVCTSVALSDIDREARVRNSHLPSGMWRGWNEGNNVGVIAGMLLDLRRIPERECECASLPRSFVSLHLRIFKAEAREHNRVFGRCKSHQFVHTICVSSITRTFGQISSLSTDTLAKRLGDEADKSFHPSSMLLDQSQRKYKKERDVSARLCKDNISSSCCQLRQITGNAIR